MVTINKEQAKWIRTNFGLSKIDLPIEFCERKDIEDYLTGKHHFRGEDYKGNSNSFLDDCVSSMELHKKNEPKFQFMRIQMLYLMTECEKLEYYELQSNLGEMSKIIETAILCHQQNDVDNTIHALLVETGIIRDDSGLEF